MKYRFILLLFAFENLYLVSSAPLSNSSNKQGALEQGTSAKGLMGEVAVDSKLHSDDHGHGVQLASFRFQYVQHHLILTSFIVIIGLFKLLYHHTSYIQRVVPESCCLIIMGAILGLCFLGNTDNVKFLEFDSTTFFFFLLPPIILESSYSLKDRAFIDNLGTIILYAVIGTMLNIVLIGGGLVAISSLGWMGEFKINPLDCLMFGSLIAAVDPVAVLAIFQEVGVNKMLYFMVFGESLLNDAVTVVCYNLVNEFKGLPEVTVLDCIMGIMAFFCVSLGGIAIGAFFGVLSAYITKYTQHVRVVEPVMLFGCSYLAFVCSELFHWSGIIGILMCGLVQAHYSCGNISSKSFISVTYFAKVASSVSESLIFIILGVMLVNENGWFWSDWHPAFSLYSLILCIIARVIVVFFLTYLANRSTGGVRYISFQEQMIMSYGGLRGAVSFSLAFMIPEHVQLRSTILAATYIIIIFTVFVQGCTMKPLVSFLNIRLAKTEEHLRLFIEFNSGMIVHLSQGIEDLVGYKDTSYLNKLGKFSKHYVRPVLQRNYVGARKSPEEKLLEADRAVTISENMRSIPSASSFKMQQEIERLTEEGQISREMIEDEDVFLHNKELFIEQQTELLVRDTMHIRQLIRNPHDNFYHNLNLVNDDDAEEQSSLRGRSKLYDLKLRAAALGKNDTRKLSNLFGRKKAKKSMHQGILLAAVGSLGVQSLNEETTTSAAEGACTKIPPHRLSAIAESENSESAPTSPHP